MRTWTSLEKAAWDRGTYLDRDMMLKSLILLDEIEQQINNKHMNSKQVVKVVGVQYSDYQRAKKRFKAGDKVELLHDSENMYDSKAVAVMCNGVRIGFLARGSHEQQAALASQVKSAVLKTFNATNPTYHMFNIELTYKTTSPKGYVKLV